MTGYMTGYFGYWKPDLGRLGRLLVYMLGLVRPDRHVWRKYMRGMATRRIQCLRCGVTAEWHGAVPRTCEETRKFLIAHRVMNS